MSELGGPGDAYDLELATASLLADGKDVHILLKVLVQQLSGAFGERLKVERKGGLLHKSDEIRSLEVAIGNDYYQAEVRGGGVACRVGHTSGGIRIRSEQVDMDDWLRRLLGALKGEAAHSQSARLALENIVIGGPA
ncbi:MAG TPA: hypothetical protein VG184_13825 [Acidimicrobiales bacterium]|nr:hypothetical protein [Acidimicrobiales bacterium]